ncbi:hypothetical protein [Ferrovibrio sp.]|uniref:hypothetical protein n=1 Tax=Ferrovibrio sp. TaxID=1917215 RepID=UPI0025C503B4|nr:hypothetical protein [Ferrovibrio sp.]
MRDLLSKADFEVHLRKMWADRGFPIENGERVGVAISDLVAHSMQRNNALSLPSLDLWISIFDECLSWFISLNTLVYAKRDKTGEMTDFEKSVTLILCKIIADGTAIRHLILLGFDTASRSLLRSVSEYMEVLVALLHKPEFSEDFIKSNTPEGAEEFWRAYLRGGKIRKRVTLAWRDFFDGHEDTAEWFGNWGRSSHVILSGLTHPSFAGGFFTTLTPKEKHVDENWLGIWGDKSVLSVDTVYIFLKFAFPVLLLSRQFPFEGFDGSLAMPILYDETDEFHRHVRIGRDILASVVLSLSTDENMRHVFPEADWSFLPDDAD